MFRNIFIVLVVSFSFFGCSVKKERVLSYPYKIVVKAKNIALADAGFLKEYEGHKSLQIFSAGKLVLHLELKENACLNGSCMTRESFNDKLFGYPYYKNIMDDVLSGKEIYNGKNKVDTKDGFKQDIRSEYYDILYKVGKKSIYFKDRKNHVLIKLERI